MKFKKEYLTILVIQITEVLGFSLILPFLPFYAQDLGATPFKIGLILSLFSICQFISAPIIGKLSDYYGRKPLLILSQFSTFISFIILGFANSLWMIYFSRAVDGILGSNFAVAQAYLSDVSSKKERSQAFGISGVAFGFGFLIGPAIGGLLSRKNYTLPSFIAAGISFLTILITAFFLKETIKRKKVKKPQLSILNIADLKKYLYDPKVSPKMWQFFIYVSAHVVWVSSFALFAQKQINLSASHIGFLLAYIGLISIILRGILLGRLIDLFGEEKLKITGMFLMTIGMFLSIFISQWELFVLVMTFFATGSGLSRPILLGGLSKSVSSQEQGAVLGVGNSLGSLAQIFGPLIGGFLINYFFPGSLGLMGALIMSLGLVLVIREEKKLRVI